MPSPFLYSLIIKFAHFESQSSLNSKGPAGLFDPLMQHPTNSRVIFKGSPKTVPTLETLRAKVSIHACAVPLRGWRKPEVERIGGKPDL